MTKPVPKFIAREHGSAHQFRAQKRWLVRAMDHTLDELRTGCAYFPGGSKPVEIIAEQLQLLKHNLSVKKWGR